MSFTVSNILKRYPYLEEDSPVMNPSAMLVFCSSTTMYNASSIARFLVTPKESFDMGHLPSEFSRAMMTTSTGSEQLGLLSDSRTCRQSLVTTMQETQQLKGQGRSLGNITVPGLTEHLSQVEQHVAKLMCVNMARSQENLNNGNTNTNLELKDLDLENKDVTRSIIRVYKCFYL